MNPIKVSSRRLPGAAKQSVPSKKIAAVLLGAVLFLPAVSGCGLKSSESYTQREMETRIRDILALPTYEHVYRDVVYASQETLLFNRVPLREARTLFSVEIVVQAGLDLSRGFDLEFPEAGTAVISLPGSEILEIDADERTIRQYFSTERGGDIDRLAYYDEIDAKKSFLREDAVSRGILTRADENARALIRNLLEFAGFETVIFRMIPGGTVGPQPGTESEEEEAADG
ncbi:MAG: DUF4230 domain-containing protein [Spirochaetia bacterium]